MATGEREAKRFSSQCISLTWEGIPWSRYACLSSVSGWVQGEAAMNDVFRKIKLVFKMVNWRIWLEGVFWLGVGMGVAALALD